MLNPKLQTRLTPAQYETLTKGNQPRAGEGGVVFTGAVRLSWPSLSKATVMRGMEGKATPKYSATGLFPHNNISVIRDACIAAIRTHYPSVADPSFMLNPKEKNHPLKDQGLKVNVSDGGLDPVGRTTAGYVPGLLYLTAKSTQQVPCIHRVSGRDVMVLPEELDATLYAGCWVNMKLVILKSTSVGNAGIFFGLQGMFKIADDIKFGGGGNAATVEDFASAVAIEEPNIYQATDNYEWT